MKMEDGATSRQAFDSGYHAVPLLNAVVSCQQCGHCISRCFLSDGYPDLNPRKIHAKILSGQFDELVDSEFIWACSLCGRCTTECPKQIAMEDVMRGLRGMAMLRGNAPERIVEGIKKAVEFGNNPGMEADAFIDMVEWLAEEVEEDFEGGDEESLAVPIDKMGAEILYMPNPREYTSNPQMFQSYLKFFAYTHTDWTMSSRVFDITNWAYYIGDHQSTMAIMRNVIEEARRLRVHTLLSTECGHGFKILRRDAEGWFGEPLGFEVLSVVELAHRYLKEGRILLEPGSVPERVTYHDPCNVGRKLGIFQEPRELLVSMVSDFVEMFPNRKYGTCCGGGGSVGQNPAMGTKKLEHAKLKRDQILKTGASIVATSCQNCLSQLSDLQTRYDMPVKIRSVVELVVQSMEAGR